MGPAPDSLCSTLSREDFGSDATDSLPSYEYLDRIPETIEGCSPSNGRTGVELLGGRNGSDWPS